MSFPDSPFVRVRARIASIWADGPDEDTRPDWRPAVGEKVTLTPSISSQLLVYDAAGPEPIIVTVERVECVVDEEGWLAKSDGRPVYIAPTDDPLLSVTGWTWTATIKDKSVVFSAPTGGVVDLAMFIAAPAVDAVERLSVAQVAAEYVALHHEELVGEPGRAVELQKTTTHVQWRYVGDSTWTDLVPLASITGDDGQSVELQTTATHIQWRLADGEWADLVALSALVGPAGRDAYVESATPPADTSMLWLDTGTPSLPESGSPFELRGYGMPNGVVTASPGTYYTDNVGTNGAWRWLKTSGTGNTGWTVVFGDTGWRDVREFASNWHSNYANGFGILARRTDSTSMLKLGQMGATVGSGISQNQRLFTLAGEVWQFLLGDGYGQQRGSMWGVVGRGSTNSPLVQIAEGVYTAGNFYADHSSTGVLTGPTAGAWPTTLPGTAV